MADEKKEGTCDGCLHMCMDMDMDPYCAAPEVTKKHPWGLNLCRGVPEACGSERKLWTKDTRR